MGKTFRVRVIKSEYKCFWYNRHIGEVFPVKCNDEDMDDFIIMGNEYPSEGIFIDCACISIDDCVVLDDIEPTKYLKRHTI